MVGSAAWRLVFCMALAAAGNAETPAGRASAQQSPRGRERTSEFPGRAVLSRPPLEGTVLAESEDDGALKSTLRPDGGAALAAGWTDAPPDQLLLRGAESIQPDAETAAAEARRWYVFVAAVNAYPRLESEEPIRRVFDPLMRAIAPGHNPVRTVGDLRDGHLLWPPHLGFGYDLSEHWGIQFQLGYTAGKVRTIQDERSIFLFPLHTDFEIYRGAAFMGLGLDYFPFGMAERGDYHGLMARLRAARPSLGTRFTLTYATYNAKVRVGIGHGPNLGLKLSDAWLVRSFNFDAGLDIPWTRHGLLHLNAGYNVFLERDYDFGGPAFTIAWKHYVR